MYTLQMKSCKKKSKYYLLHVRQVDVEKLFWSSKIILKLIHWLASGIKCANTYNILLAAYF